MSKMYGALPKVESEATTGQATPDMASDAELVQKRQDIEKNGALLANVGDDLDQRLMTVTQPYSFAAEQFKILRSRILYPNDGRVCRTIMITSALAGEGKSLIAANLAISVAQGIREHVLLVDCDIRIPGQHLLFRVSGEKGLSDYLARNVPLNDLLAKTAIDKLTLLPGGIPPENPAELLSSEKMGHFIDEVKNRYDDRFIIFDATPAEITAEVSVLAKRVDGILLVVKRGHTERDLIKRVVEGLDRNKIVGVVFNEDAAISSRYGYKGYSYQNPAYMKKA